MFKNFVRNCLVFVVGAAAGTGITYLVLSRKHAAEMDKEISDIRELYLKRKSEPKPAAEEKTFPLSDDDLTSYINKKEEEKAEDDIRIIPEEEYDYDDNKKESWKVYDDGITVKEDRSVIRTDDIKTLFNEDIFYELNNVEDVLFVRNITKGIDYEFIKQLTSYNE